MRRSQDSAASVDHGVDLRDPYVDPYEYSLHQQLVDCEAQIDQAEMEFVSLEHGRVPTDRGAPSFTRMELEQIIDELEMKREKILQSIAAYAKRKDAAPDTLDSMFDEGGYGGGYADSLGDSFASSGASTLDTLPTARDAFVADGRRVHEERKEEEEVQEEKEDTDTEPAHVVYNPPPSPGKSVFRDAVVDVEVEQMRKEAAEMQAKLAEMQAKLDTAEKEKVAIETKAAVEHKKNLADKMKSAARTAGQLFEGATIGGWVRGVTVQREDVSLTALTQDIEKLQHTMNQHSMNERFTEAAKLKDVLNEKKTMLAEMQQLVAAQESHKGELSLSTAQTGCVRHEKWEWKGRTVVIKRIVKPTA